MKMQNQAELLAGLTRCWWLKCDKFYNGGQNKQKQSEKCANRSIAVVSVLGSFSNTHDLTGVVFSRFGKHMSTCLHWSAIALPAASCVPLPFGGAILLIGSKIAPPNTWGTNLKLFTWISSSPKISQPPFHNFGLQHQLTKPPLPNP